ncbi:MAG: VOC family protein, partial [Anaerolineae bacterium]
MSRLFGEIIQNGYVLRDIEAAMRHWIAVLGVGPWFYIEHLPVTDFQYKGQPSPVDISIALANSGALQVELIQQRNDAPSLYRDFLAAGHEGLQHLGYGTKHFDADLARILKAGYAIGHAGSVSGRGPFVYLLTEA